MRGPIASVGAGADARSSDGGGALPPCLPARRPRDPLQRSNLPLGNDLFARQFLARGNERVALHRESLQQVGELLVGAREFLLIAVQLATQCRRLGPRLRKIAGELGHDLVEALLQLPLPPPVGLLNASELGTQGLTLPRQALLLGAHPRGDLRTFGQLAIEALQQLRLAARELAPRSGKLGRRGREPPLELGLAALGVLARAHELRS